MQIEFYTETTEHKKVHGEEITRLPNFFFLKLKRTISILRCSLQCILFVHTGMELIG